MENEITGGELYTSKKGVIRILKESFSILRRYPLILVPYLGYAVLSFVLPHAPMRGSPQEISVILDFYRDIYRGGWGILLSFIEIFVIAMIITMTYAFHREKVRVSLQKALGNVWSKVSRLICVYILHFLIAVIASFIGVVLVTIGVSLGLTVLEHIGEFIFFVLFILALIFFAFVYHGIIIDNMRVIEAFKNSYRIAKDNFWTMIGIGVVAPILGVIFSWGVIGIISIFHEIQTSIMDIIFGTSSVLLTCYLIVALTLLYISRRPGND